MEFFALAPVRLSAEQLQASLSIAQLPRLCASIDKVLSDRESHGEIYCVWGQFRVHREAINGGVRFTLPDCPNGLAWTLTTGHPPAPDAVVVHCTIARTEHEPDFVESLQAFVDDWQAGLQALDRDR